MKTSRLFLLGITALTLSACNPAGPTSQGGGTDAKLYHLTLTSNIELTAEQKNDLKCTYAYGVRDTVVIEGTRPQEQINELKQAGATDADIQKAGKRQADGSYYFFDQDPIFIQAPNVVGYKMNGFYDGAAFVYKPGLTLIDGEKLQGSWNMSNKDITLQASYLKLSYSYYFDVMDPEDVNPNSNGTYCYLDEGKKSLLPATTTNKHKQFVGWEYQDSEHLDSEGIAPWILLENGELPIDYTEEIMRIRARWDVEMHKVSFDFVKDVGGDSPIDMEYDDVIASMSVNGNITTVDGVKEKCEGYPGTAVTKNSVIKMGYGSWLNIFFNLKEGIRVFYFEINGVRQDSIDESHMEHPYINIHNDKVGGDYLIHEDSVITFVLADIVE